VTGCGAGGGRGRQEGVVMPDRRTIHIGFCADNLKAKAALAAALKAVEHTIRCRAQAWVEPELLADEPYRTIHVQFCADDLLAEEALAAANGAVERTIKGGVKRAWLDLVAGNCNFYGSEYGDCAGPVEWRWPEPNCAVALCESHWEWWRGPEGQAVLADVDRPDEERESLSWPEKGTLERRAAEAEPLTLEDIRQMKRDYPELP
jgi:hypothetical protein